MGNPVRPAGVAAGSGQENGKEADKYLEFAWS
jgi:hypothetical protein